MKMGKAERELKFIPLDEEPAMLKAADKRHLKIVRPEMPAALDPASAEEAPEAGEADKNEEISRRVEKLEREVAQLKAEVEEAESLYLAKKNKNAGFLKNFNIQLNKKEKDLGQSGDEERGLSFKYKGKKRDYQDKLLELETLRKSLPVATLTDNAGNIDRNTAENVEQGGNKGAESLGEKIAIIQKEIEKIDGQIISRAGGNGKSNIDELIEKKQEAEKKADILYTIRDISYIRTLIAGGNLELYWGEDGLRNKSALEVIEGNSGKIHTIYNRIIQDDGELKEIIKPKGAEETLNDWIKRIVRQGEKYEIMKYFKK